MKINFAYEINNFIKKNLNHDDSLKEVYSSLPIPEQARISLIPQMNREFNLGITNLDVVLKDEIRETFAIANHDNQNFRELIPTNMAYSTNLDSDTEYLKQFKLDGYQKARFDAIKKDSSSKPANPINYQQAADESSLHYEVRLNKEKKENPLLGYDYNSIINSQAMQTPYNEDRYNIYSRIKDASFLTGQNIVEKVEQSNLNAGLNRKQFEKRYF